MRTIERCALHLCLLVAAALVLKVFQDFTPSPVHGGVVGLVLTLTYYFGVFRGREGVKS